MIWQPKFSYHYGKFSVLTNHTFLTIKYLLFFGNKFKNICIYFRVILYVDEVTLRPYLITLCDLKYPGQGILQLLSSGM
jgi:hypothetical protein